MPSHEEAEAPRKGARVAISGSTRFLNRDKQLRQGLERISAVVEKPSEFSILEVVGPGGAGKTRLLQELRDTARELASSPKRVIWVPLAAEAVSSEAGPLLLIRNEFSFDCLLHDTALLTYWNATGQSPRLDLSDPLARSLPVRLLQEGGKAVGIPLPLPFGIELFKYAKAKWAKSSRYHPEEFEAIDELRDTPDEILRRLPEFLALDIVRALDPNEELIAFYDGYEKQKPSTLASQAPWLRTFLRNLDSGAHVISSREPLQWDEGEWEGVIGDVTVGPLPCEQSRELIRARLGKLDEPVVKRMLKSSRCLPFFLEAIVDAIPGDMDQAVSLDELPSPGEDPVDHLLSHLGGSQRKLTVALAAVQVFDRELFKCLVGDLFLTVDLFEFENLPRRFYVEPFPPLLHKTHDLLTEFVREATSATEMRKRALQAVTEDLPLRCLRNRLTDTDALLPILAAVVAGWYSVDDPGVSSVESLIDAGYMLYDAGYWAEIGSLRLDERDADHPISVAAEFLAALAARRTDGVDRSRELLANLDGRVSCLGRHRESVKLETAYLSELGGDYTSARREFVDLESRIDRFDPTDRLHVRARLYLADMQIMDGDLESGARLLLESYETELLSDLDWAELVRHRGHAFRFSFIFDTAVDLYLKAMRAAKRLLLPALEAKLWTNLTEARCWSDPSLALDDARSSTEMNQRLGNRIELAKCEAARAIALAQLGQFKEANKAVAAAQRGAERVGYPAAAAFALQAQAISLGLRRSGDAAAARLELERSLAKLGTYSHLAVAPLCAGGEEAEFERRVATFGWQEPDGVADRIRRHLNA